MYNADFEGDAGARRLPSDPPGNGGISAIEIPPLVAIGIGGRIELVAEQIRLIKGGIFGHAVELLWLGYGVIEKSIPMREISAVEIVKPLLMPDFIRFSYPGSPRQTGSYIDDALAENALIMSWFDNRAFYRIKARIERSPHLPPLPAIFDASTDDANSSTLR
jgi:hypothetical protein